MAKVRVWSKDVTAQGMRYPRLSLVPDGVFDPLRLQRLQAQGLVVEIEGTDLPPELPEPYVPEPRQPVFLEHLGVARLRLDRARQELADAEADLLVLEQGGQLVAIKGGGTAENEMVMRGNPDLPDAKSPLDPDPEIRRIAAEADADEPYTGTAVVVPEDALVPADEQEQRTPTHLRG